MVNEDKTAIWIRKEQRDKLEKLKVHPRATFQEVIDMLLEKIEDTAGRLPFRTPIHTLNFIRSFEDHAASFEHSFLNSTEEAIV